MSERKVLNKYYPPDFDPSKLPRVKRPKNRQFTIRLMAPCNMRCRTCGEYIYKGKKFNARKEDVIGTTYLGIQIYRFYIKCTRCLAEITFKTDPANGDYELEHGAIRMFECVRLAERKLKEEVEEKKNEEANNPMKILENRTRDSRREIVALEDLENIQQINAKNAEVDITALANFQNEYEKQLRMLQIEEEEAEIKRIFSHKSADDIQIKEEKVEKENSNDEILTNDQPSNFTDKIAMMPPSEKHSVSQRSLLLSAVSAKRKTELASSSTVVSKTAKVSASNNNNGLLVNYEDSSNSD